MTARYAVFLSLYFGGLLVRDICEVVEKSGKPRGRGRHFFIVIAAAMTFLWTGWFTMCSLDPWRSSLGTPWRLTGFGITAAGCVLAIGSFLGLKKLQNTEQLVTTGLFRRMRHPMYLGFILWFPGWALAHGAPVSFIAGIPGMASILWWRKLEEAELESRCKDSYREYRKQTWL